MFGGDVEGIVFEDRVSIVMLCLSLESIERRSVLATSSKLSVSWNMLFHRLGIYELPVPPATAIFTMIVDLEPKYSVVCVETRRIVFGPIQRYKRLLCN